MSSKFLFDNIKHYECTQCLEAYNSLSDFMDHQLENPDCEDQEPRIVMDEKFEKSMLEEENNSREHENDFCQYRML